MSVQWKTTRDLGLAAVTLLMIVGLVMVAGALVAAQQPAAAPAFEVASVKQNTTGGPVMIGMRPGGRYTATNVPLQLLLRQAFRLQDFQIIGMPDWATTDRFDISAKGDGEVAPDQMPALLRGLLADRFGLQSHSEQRELPIYALVLARNDGRFGPNLKASTANCAAPGRGRGGEPGPAPAGPGTTTMPLRGGCPGGPAGPGAPGQGGAGGRGVPMSGPAPPCGMRMAPGNVAAGGFPLSQLATTLAPMVGRVVQDKTGLSGSFDFELTWTPDPGPGGGRDAAPAPDTGGVSLFTAIQEQLGLKLESQRAPVDVVVIDRLNRPTPD